MRLDRHQQCRVMLKRRTNGPSEALHEGTGLIHYGAVIICFCFKRIVESFNKYYMI